MPEKPEGLPTKRPVLERELLEAKFTCPPRPNGIVSRQRLVDEATGSGARIVGVTAPAGYGKTTLLAEWVSVDARPTGWVSIDRFDDDPAALLTILATALMRMFPDMVDIAAEMHGLGDGTLGRSAPLLASAFAGVTEPFLLIIDDLHEAGSPACQDVLEVAFKGIPEGAQVVLASRHEQPHLARRRVEGVTFEIGVQELRADIDAARSIFSNAGVEIDDSALDRLVERSEGWPTGLFLAALLAREGIDPSSMTGDDRFVADYLYRECVRHLPEESQQFLRRTAVLEQMSGRMCDAVLERTGSNNLLHDLEARGLFLVPLDHRRGWYRYHALFREFLLDELLSVDDDAMVTGLHLSAATWCEQHGLRAQAIEHRLAAGDRPYAARLVASESREMYKAGQVVVMRRWLEELGDEAIQGYPPLAVLAGWSAAVTGEPAEAERWATLVARARYDDPGADDLPSFESAQAMLRIGMLAHGCEQAVTDASLAVSREPSWSPWRDLALYLSGEVSLLVGDLDTARVRFQDAASLVDQSGITDAVLLSEAHLAIFARHEHAWAEAARHVDFALNAIDETHREGYPTTALALAVGAQVELHRGDRRAAERLLARGMRARAGCTHALPFMSMRVRLQLAIAALAIGDGTTALLLLDELDELLAVRPDVGELAIEIEAFRRHVQNRPVHEGLVPLTPAELRVLPYLQTHLTLHEIAERLFLSRNTVSTQVGSIYRKLQVASRSDAVEQARAGGLLGP